MTLSLETLAAITINQESTKTNRQIQELLNHFDSENVKMTIMADMAYYFHVKESNRDLAQQIELTWKEAIEKNHDVQLLLRIPFSSVLIQKSKETLESLLKPIKSEYQLFAFRFIGSFSTSYKESYETLLSYGLYCDSTVCKKEDFFPCAYSQHQPYFANLHAPQLKAPTSEVQLLELPIFTTQTKKSWSLDADFVKNLKCFIKYKNKQNKYLNRYILIKKIFRKLCLLYTNFSWPRSIINKFLPARFLYFITDQKPEFLVKKNYFVTDGNVSEYPKYHSLLKQVNFVTLSTMANSAKGELLNALRKNSFEEAEFQILENYNAIMGEVRNTDQSYYLQNLIPWDCDTVLDFGCGSGYWTKRITQIYPWIQKAIGIDYGEDFIKKANSRYKNTSIAFVKENFEAMSFDAKTFDCVYADSTLEHAFDVNKALHEIYRVLREGGALVAIIPSDARNPQRINPSHTWKTFPLETKLRLEAIGFVNIEIEELDVYKTFAMAPYPPSDNYLMFIRAWKLPSSNTTLARMLHAMDWLHHTDISKLSKIDPNLNRNKMLKKLLEREGHALSLDNGKLYATIENKKYILDPISNQYSLDTLPLKWISIQKGSSLKKEYSMGINPPT